ncbi:MAG: hypothetical protein VX776_09340 [Planctomycetota bacterium]|nr:hypothetical protein [Planctomycetota bacterium]
MAKLTALFGLLLIGNGIYGYTGSQSEKESLFDQLDSNADQTLAIDEQESVFDKYSKLKELNAPVDKKQFLEKTVSMTTLIPAFVGIVLLLCAVGSMAKPSLNKHLMHLAATLGLLGCLAALVPLGMSLFKDKPNSLSQFNQVLMVVLCGGYVYFCYRSFKEAGRRRREAAAMETSTADVPATVDEQ